MARVNGTVKFFNHSRGFGFIQPEDGGKDVFVHASALERSGVPALNEGEKVSFEIEDDRRGRGKQAANVQLAYVSREIAPDRPPGFVPGGFLLLGHVSARFEDSCRNKLQFTATKGTLCWPRFAAKARLARPPKP